MEYKLLLIEWGLGSYDSAFEEEGIDDESFKLLDDETINKIFTKSGPKLIFKKKFREYIKEEFSSNTPSTSSIDIESAISTDASSGGASYSYMADSDFALELSPELSLTNEGKDLLTVIDVPKSTSPVKSYIEILDQRLLDSSKSIESPSAKKPKLDIIFMEGLQTVLKKYIDGQIILLNKQKLNNDMRQKLAKIIINELMSIFGHEIKTSTFLKATQEIISFFPNEVSETYYIPYKPKKEFEDLSSSTKCFVKSSNAKGKLWSRYIYVRAALRLANSQKENIEKKPKKTSVSPEPNKEEVSSLQFLKIGTEPFTKVLEAWEQTYKQRKKLYLNCEVSKFFTDFPCLKLNSGIELIESDFNRKFPEKIDIIYSTWPKVAQAICEEAREKKMSLGENIDPTETSSALLILPYLFSPVTLKKSRKSGNWRPTRSEVAESFFLQIESLDELENRISQRKDKLTEYQLTFQPCGVFIGNPANPNVDIYIIVEDVRYQMQSHVRAIELLFKLFHALDIEYPAECEHIWLFVEELVFQMKASKKMPSTASVVADIKYHMDRIQ